ncbi:MerR family transcriptional regulator [Kineosporia sp. NBRC 101731]|uniref:MerR family transcriptional regulator n=1 Tax=Kineosporia sp. NBRC 101731 TaxID=3032199 RepID=UPI0024A2B1F9|nr:MerR family transcriptional regulator [Kineosporia sp. NBRC 101731]GLY33338.1 MerR family transcriptional regulator [Kineosporia sp. NBRC 101731]
MIAIGELAQRAGVSVRALRYYEEQGLLESSRNGRGHREYPESSVERVRVIQNLYAAGLSSQTILEVCPHRETGTAAYGERLGRLQTVREQLDHRVGELLTARARLDDVIDSLLAVM